MSTTITITLDGYQPPAPGEQGGITFNMHMVEHEAHSIEEQRLARAIFDAIRNPMFAAGPYTWNEEAGVTVVDVTRYIAPLPEVDDADRPEPVSP